MIIMNVEPVDFARELYISDLDGTLLSPQSEISPYTRGVLIEALQKGLQFSVASARSYFSIRQLFQGIPLNLPVIANNGAVLFSAEGVCLFRFCIKDETLEKLYTLIKALELTPLLSVEDDQSVLYYASDCSPNIARYMKIKQASGDPRLTEISDVYAIKKGIITLTLLDDEATMGRAFEVFQSAGFTNLNFYRMPLPDIDGLYTLTVISAEADKGKTLGRLRKHLNGDLHITVFGDHLNDLTLFEEADTKIAVANAEETLKLMADLCILSNEEDGVAHYIKARLDGR